VAAVIRRGADVFAVRRPLDDDDLPGIWGLPAITLSTGELPEDGVRRLGREKLGVSLVPVRMLGIDAQERPRYRLILMDVEARVEEGSPDPARAATDATRYIDGRWTSDLGLFQEGADRGSLCCQILLEASKR
jgi:ADP-ribose pyrophosphatase YjhB (NUDIX family)